MRPEYVKRVVLLDPITLFMHRPGACKSFLYEKDMNQGFVKDLLSYLFNRGEVLRFANMLQRGVND